MEYSGIEIHTKSFVNLSLGKYSFLKIDQLLQLFNSTKSSKAHILMKNLYFSKTDSLHQVQLIIY